MATAIALAAGLPETLPTLEILEGDGAIYNLRGRGFTMPRVRVSEPDGRPVKGAAVTFRLPDAGPGAQFADGRIAMVQTDDRGEATVPPVRLNSQLGQWEIRIAATHRGGVARASLQQINAAPVEAMTSPGKKSKSLYWLVAIAAGAATAATVGLAGSGSPPRSGGVSVLGTAAAGSPPTLSISPGSSSAGAP